MKRYRAHFKGSFKCMDVSIDVYARDMKEAWDIARTYNTGFMLDEVYPTNDDWS